MTCQQNNCDKEATYIVYWPGQTTRQCKECTDKLVRIGEVMGIPVSVQQIGVIAK